MIGVPQCYLYRALYGELTELLGDFDSLEDAYDRAVEVYEKPLRIMYDHDCVAYTESGDANDAISFWIFDAPQLLEVKGD